MTNLPREIRKWVRDENLDVKTRVRFRNLADEIERLEAEVETLRHVAPVVGGTKP